VALARTRALRGASAGLVARVVTPLIEGVGILVVAPADPGEWQTALGGDVDREVIHTAAPLAGVVGLAT